MNLKYWGLPFRMLGWAVGSVFLCGVVVLEYLGILFNPWRRV